MAGCALAEENGKSYRIRLSARLKGDSSVKSLRGTNPALARVDGTILRLEDFPDWERAHISSGDVLSSRISLSPGDHTCEKIENDFFSVDWILIEPGYAGNPVPDSAPDCCRVMFTRCSPVKYVVTIEGARTPFWLVFSESYHEGWKLYDLPERMNGVRAGNTRGTKPGWRTAMQFNPGDIRYLFQKPRAFSHRRVNGYANGWYIDPAADKIGGTAAFALYFRPQCYFYLGLFISMVAITGCIVYLFRTGKRQ